MSVMRLGIIGPGLIWQRHEPQLLAHPEAFQIAAFAASSNRAREECARKYPAAPFTTDYREMLRSDGIDGVLVLTPIRLNAPVAIAALEAGKHVFLEKPMACSLADAAALLAAAERAGKRLEILEQDGFDVRWPAIRELLRSGAIGQVVTYDLVSHHYFDGTVGAPSEHGVTGWRKEADFPLGRLFDGGHHTLARLATIFGQPDSIFAAGTKLRPLHGEFDHVITVLHYSGGVRGCLNYGGYLPDRRNHLHVYGTDGVITLEGHDTLLIEGRDGSARSVALPTERSYTTMWGAITAAITRGDAVPYTWREALRELTTLLKIQESATTGRVVAW
jgi:predicted dehydrogenase